MDCIADPRVRATIDRLQQASRAQEGEIGAYFARRIQANDLSWDGLDEGAHRFFADKLVALDDDKASFCHRVCRALGARTVVEVGTSHGVSTLYLADAVRANGGGVVIATEHEAAKAAAARAHFAEAGIGDLIDLREGDLRRTLQVIDHPVDFVLMDIWTEMVVPALALIEPHLRKGAVIVADNTTQVAPAYAPYFAHLARGGYTTQTLPFTGGLEFTVRV